MQFLRSNRAVPDCMGAQVMSMRRSGIRTCHILNHLAAERGGHKYVPFLKKDLYNWIGRQRELEEEEETDAEGALGYLECLGLRDPNFFETHTKDGEYRLADLFWADGISRDDYGRFGEIIAFDTTYKKNAYNKPLLLFVDVNHHFRTVVFAVALLYDEKEDTYIWLLEEFLQCMNNKLPQVVVTDGDKAMAKAIEKVMPNAVHRLCAWHLQKNVTINVPHPIFKTRFNELLYQYCTKEEFDESWSGLVTEFQLQDSQWAAITYNNRRSWAECFLLGNFFAGLRTTQRSESMNSYLSHFLTSKLKLKDLVGQVDKAIQSIRHTEREDDFISNNTSPQFPSNILQQYYQQVASVLTRNMYDKVAQQIDNALAYSIDLISVEFGCRVFSLSRFRRGLVRSVVRYVIDHDHFECSCMLFQSDGIPCRHMFAVMKHLNLPCIPKPLLKERWRKDAKLRGELSRAPHDRVPRDVLLCTRWGSLTSRLNAMGYYATQRDDTYEEALSEMSRLEEKFKTTCGQPNDAFESRHVVHGDYRSQQQQRVIGDPAIVRTKGREPNKTKSKYKGVDNATPRKNRCRNCNQLGHDRATCKVVPEVDNQSMETEDPTSSNYPMYYTPNVDDISQSERS
ncbi:protein FAR1-RELATED SEQUENCE 5-like [Humulus lupulus]|uniref:protein FAR1-RELATED SEQUENCE 5-like n=1 Tax=Humulus lupulus TaxID=3486 RepID=UPI002B400C20|nr:protein FAR1-RELATED SEQUENCE 5-like [Humulus lupulus]